MAADPSAFNQVDLDANSLPSSAIGATGTKLSGRDVWNIDDYNAQFKGAKGIENCEMIRRDPVVAAALGMIKNKLASRRWRFSPAKTKKGKNGKLEASDADKAIAEAAEQDFIDRQYGATPLQPIRTFANLLEHIQLELDFGSMCFCFWWVIGDSGRHVIEVLPLLPSSYVKFEIDPLTRGLGGLHQRAFDPITKDFQNFFIPAEQLAHFGWKQEGDNYWGQSALRPVFKPWDLKCRLELIEAIACEKHGAGVDELHGLQHLTPTELAAAQQLIQNIRGHERGGILTSYKLKYELHDTNGSAIVAIGAAIGAKNEEMLLALFSQGLMMGGTQADGNRSLGETKQEDVHILLQGIVNGITSNFTRQWVIPWTIANFGPQVAYPTLELAEPLDKLAGTVLAEMLKIGSDAKVITPGKRTEEWYRGILQAPEEDEPYIDPAAPPEPPPGAGDVPPGNNDPKKLSKHFSAIPNPYPEFGQDVPLRRELFDHERHVAFRDMKRFLDEEPARIWHRTIEPIRSEQIAKLARAAAGSTEAAISQDKLPRPDVRRMANELNDSLLEVYRRGRYSVIEDAARSRRGETADDARARFSRADDEAEFLDEYPIEPSGDEKSWIRRLSEGFALVAILGLVTEAVAAAQRAQAQELSRSEAEAFIRSALEALSEPRVQANLSARVAQTYTTGRVDQGEKMADQITSVFYSAVLDDGTCQPCWARDGQELDPDTWSDAVPNPNCDAGIDRCRCEPVFIFRPKEAAAA